MWLRLRQIALVASELEPIVEDLGSVFGLEVCFRDPGVATFGLENADRGAAEDPDGPAKGEAEVPAQVQEDPPAHQSRALLPAREQAGRRH